MGEGDFPVSDMLAARSIWLYHEALLGEEESVRLIAHAIEKVIQGKDEIPL